MNGQVVRLHQDATRDELIEAVAGALAPEVADDYRAACEGMTFTSAKGFAAALGVYVIPGAPKNLQPPT